MFPILLPVESYTGEPRRSVNQSNDMLITSPHLSSSDTATYGEAHPYPPDEPINAPVVGESRCRPRSVGRGFEEWGTRSPAKGVQPPGERVPRSVAFRFGPQR